MNHNPPPKKKPYQFIGLGAMDVTKPYEFICLGAMDVTKPYEFTGFGAMDATKPYEFIRSFGGALSLMRGGPIGTGACSIAL